VDVGQVHVFDAVTGRALHHPDPQEPVEPSD
jgi:hypothetical protein